jgi:bacterioferritin-associated ferredoxin
MSGKVLVCRCEDVTLGELEEAIERGHDDIESLKRYTGFGTGYCQGKHCLALCARLLRGHGGDASLPFTPRPPFHPVPLAHLAALGDDPPRIQAESPAPEASRTGPRERA